MHLLVLSKNKALVQVNMYLLCFFRVAVEMEFNPWNVSSIEQFLFYNCPECESKYSNREQFVGHAMVAHENARDILMTILRSENVKASNEDNLDPEGFDVNGNDNCMGIQIAKVESITDDLTEINSSSGAEDTSRTISHTSNVHEDIEEVDYPEGFDDNGNDNNEGIHFKICDETTSDPLSFEVAIEDIDELYCTESLSYDEPETYETSTLNPPVTVKISNEQKKPMGENLLVKPEKHRLNNESKKCEECGKGFITPSKLQRHSYSHSGLRPFQCTICAKSFSQSANLKTHIKNTHPETFQPSSMTGMGIDADQLHSQLQSQSLANPKVFLSAATGNNPEAASAATAPASTTDDAIAKAIAEPKSEPSEDNSESSNAAGDNPLQPDY